MGRTGWIYKVGPTFSGQTCEANERELLYERERECSGGGMAGEVGQKGGCLCKRRWKTKMGALVSCVDRDGTYEYLTIWPPIVENIINENQT